MGTDIHLFAEYEDEHGVHSVADGAFAIPRDYELFAALAGVRGRSALIAPRGVPAALSAGVFQHLFCPIVDEKDQRLWHGFDFVTSAEARRQIADGRWVFSDQQPATSWIQSRLGYVVQPDAHTVSHLSLDEIAASLQHHALTLADTPLEFQLLLFHLRELEARREGAQARIVFWFFS